MATTRQQALHAMTPEQIRKEVERRFKTLQELKCGDPRLLSFIKTKGWEHKCLYNLRRTVFKNKPSKEECRKIAVMFPTIEAFLEHDWILYQYIRQKMWRQYCFNHMLGFKHEPENCRMAMARFTTAKDATDAGFGYLLGYLNGYKELKEQCCGHFVHKLKYTIFDCLAECKKYSSLFELRTNNNAMYVYVRLHGYQEVCFAHFEDLDDAERNSVEDFKLTRSPISGPSQRLTYKFCIPLRDDIITIMRVANNLYNQTLYEWRTAFTDEDDPQWLSYYTLRERVREMPNLEGGCNFRDMPHDHLADRVVQSVALACNEFARQCREHKPGMPIPGLPRFRPKGGLYQLRFSQKRNGGRAYIKKGKVNLTNDIQIDIPDFDKYRDRLRHLVMGTIIPRYTHLEVALIYDVALTPDADVDESEYAAIDLGMQNLVTMVDRHQTTIYHGGFLKSYNQYYNDQLRRLLLAAHWKVGDPYTKRMSRLVAKRNAYMADVTHKISAHLVQYLRQRHIGVLIIGWNGDVQQTGKLTGNTQRLFQLIPFGKLIDKIMYKCEQVGIHVVLTEESHTSKCDALALEPICHHDEYLGRRTHRGLFVSSTGKVLNADVNGAINIMRKVIGDCSFVKDIIGSGHLFCPVGHRHPFGWHTDKPEQATLRDGC